MWLEVQSRSRSESIAGAHYIYQDISYNRVYASSSVRHCIDKSAKLLDGGGGGSLNK